jgi:hypothetical protein
MSREHKGAESSNGGQSEGYPLHIHPNSKMKKRKRKKEKPWHDEKDAQPCAI